MNSEVSVSNDLKISVSLLVSQESTRADPPLASEESIKGYLQLIKEAGASMTDSASVSTTGVRSRWESFKGFLKVLCIRVGNVLSSEDTRLTLITERLQNPNTTLGLNVQDLRWFDDRTIAQLGLKKGSQLRSVAGIDSAARQAITGANKQLTKIALAIFSQSLSSNAPPPPFTFTVPPAVGKRSPPFRL